MAAVFGAEVYRNSTGVLVLGKSAGKDSRACTAVMTVVGLLATSDSHAEQAQSSSPARTPVVTLDDTNACRYYKM